VICLDFSHPWTIVETLEKWLNVLRECLTSVRKLVPEVNLEEQLVNYWQSYEEPPEDAATRKKTKRRAPIVITDQEGPSHVPEGVLKNNLGIPIVIVCTKSDSVVMLEKNYDFKSPTFDFIQLYLRRICLQYGATLVYTSAKKDINTDILMDYVEHRLFHMEFRYRASLLENESIFVPAGWDTEEKILGDLKSMNVRHSLDEPFTAVVKIPFQAKRQAPANVITFEDDQTFLTKYKNVLEKEDAEAGVSHSNWRTASSGTPMTSFSPFLSPLSSASAPPSPHPSTLPYPTTPTSPYHSAVSPLRADLADDISHSPLLGGKKPGKPLEGDQLLSQGAKDKHVLATFFDALMKSKDNRRLDPTSPGSSKALFSTPQTRQDVEKELERLKKAAGSK